MTKGRWADIASGWASALDPTLLGFGLFLAWAQCMPWVKSHVVGFSGLSGVNVTLHGLILIGMALVANYRHVRISSSPTVLAAGALATLVPCLSFLATLGGDIAVACSIAEGVVEGASLAAFYLLWHEQHARRPQRAAWTGYAASFAVAPLAYFLVTALPGPLGLATTVALPPASCLLLWLCMRRDWFSTDAGERVPEDDNASRPWRIPWRPALLMAVFSFTYYMLVSREFCELR